MVVEGEPGEDEDAGGPNTIEETGSPAKGPRRQRIDLHVRKSHILTVESSL